VFPGIAGQHADYLKAQLLAWRDGKRSEDPLGMMASVAKQLTESEIDALAAWYAAQPSGLAQAAMDAQLRPTQAVAVSDHEVHGGNVPHHGPISLSRAPDDAGYFQPPPRWSYPTGPFGDAVRQGEQIFERTNTHQESGRFVGNEQACGNCHIDAGRLASSAPLWAAYVAYPAYRTKNDKVNTYIERIQGCFKYSMNAQASAAGGPPAADSDTIVSLVAYSYWLATAAPTGDQMMPGRGYQKLSASEQPPDAERGKQVYAAKCTMCHGAEGQGVIGTDGETVFPPLWGAGAYNWGAGMHRIKTAAAFIKGNMPLGLGNSLTDQQAWDTALFMNSHERPQDPRFNGTLEETAQRFHASEDSLYGKPGLDGKPLGSNPARR
jgi:thiosulfate dehydrogenase